MTLGPASTTAPGAAAEALARFAAELTFERLPATLVEDTKLRFLDVLGCGLAAHSRGHARSVSEGLRTLYSEGQATVLGEAAGLPGPAAACVNGALCHALDFDDTHPGAITNVTAVIGPAVLAAAELSGAAGQECLVALIIGSEIAVRLGLAAAPAFMRSGFHPTSVCGVFGAAAAVSRLWGLDRRATCNSLAIAGSLASGIYEHLADGSSTKILHPGWAAQSGLIAAAFARSGLDGPATVLEGTFGVLRSHFGLPGDVITAQLDGLGEQWLAGGIAFRPYPACNMLHSSLDSVQTILATGHSSPADIREVRVSVPAPAAAIVLEPIDIKRRPRSAYDARFSLPYSVASLIVHGRVDLDTYTEAAISDPAVLSLADRVRYVAAEFATFPESYPCSLEIEYLDGSVARANLNHHRGSPAYPMAAADVLGKFRSNATEALGWGGSAALEAAAMSLDRADDVGALSACLRAVATATTAPRTP